MKQHICSIGMSDSNFLREIAQKEDNNIQEEQRVSDEENYQTDRYEQERFTDTYNEDFQDDCDKVIGSLMIMPIVKNLPTNQIGLLRL